jgi:hypothetical protein
MNIAPFVAAAATLAVGQGDHSSMPGMQMNDMNMSMMSGALGSYSMTLDGSGTAWNPAASPMYMLMLPNWGRYSVGLMGLATFNFTDQGGPRGESKLFSNSMVMLMAQRETGGGTLSYRGMFSADALVNGEEGYPLLFQTGETAHGKPLVDRQHPHDLISELAISYSHPIKGNLSLFGYAGLAGEPALGDVMYLHRPSTGDNPEAPITHHWFDSTHIAYGVLTIGATWGSKWKVDASWFNGHEPDENRYDIDPIKLDSYSARVEFNPTREWSISASYGYLKEPESLEPGLGVHRLTGAIQYQKKLDSDRSIGVGLFYGNNFKHGESSAAWNLEGSYVFGKNDLFARYENVDKDELVGVPAGSYNINKLSLGLSHNFLKRDGLEWAIAGQVSTYSFPASLDSYYGRNPVSFGVFLRVRPERMH